jgi:hypothetical protein
MAGAETYSMDKTLIHVKGRESAIKNFEEHNRRKREALLNLSSLQGTLSTIKGELGTKIRH